MLLDVKFRGKWDGILVVNSERQCIGLHLGGKTVQRHLPFRPEEIEDFRPACPWNLFLSRMPFGVIYWLPYICVLIMPILIAMTERWGNISLVAAFGVGLAGQFLVIDNRPTYCIPGGPIVLIIAIMQLVVLVKVVTNWL